MLQRNQTYENQKVYERIAKELRCLTDA